MYTECVLRRGILYDVSIERKGLLLARFSTPWTADPTWLASHHLVENDDIGLVKRALADDMRT